MERPKRAATKVTNFRKYHLSGNLDNEVQGIVDCRVNQPEMAASTEELKQKLEQEREQSKKMQEDAEHAELQHQIELEKMKLQQWQTAIQKLQEAKTHAEQEHSKCIEQMKQVANANMEQATSFSLSWLKTQMGKITDNQGPSANTSKESLSKRAQEQERQAALAELKKQQEELRKYKTCKKIPPAGTHQQETTWVRAPLG